MAWTDATNLGPCFAGILKVNRPLSFLDIRGGLMRSDARYRREQDTDAPQRGRNSPSKQFSQLV
jgi:hypothetical protein